MLQVVENVKKYALAIKIALFVNLIFSIITLGVKGAVFSADSDVFEPIDYYNFIVTSPIAAIVEPYTGQIRPFTLTKWWAYFVVLIPFFDAMIYYARDLWKRGMRTALVALTIVVSINVLASAYLTSILFGSRFGHPFVDDVFGPIFGLFFFWLIVSAMGAARIVGEEAMSVYVAKTINVPAAIAIVYTVVSFGFFGLSFARV